MAYELFVTKSAELDLAGIIQYYIEELENRKAAKQLLDEVETAYHRISANPMLYEFCRDTRLKEKGYHKCLVRNYLIIYSVFETDKRVYINRIFYSRRNYEQLI